MKKKVNHILLPILLLISACQQREQPIYQLSTIESLMSGNYDGRRHTESLKLYGNFGIGTFDKLDGEMIFYKGEIFKAKSNGVVVDATESETTPYASVCFFQPSIEFSFSNVKSVAELDSIISKHLPNITYIYAIEITGMFDSVKVRSVKKQDPPFYPLVEVVKNQTIMVHSKLSGALIGFYAPSSVKDIMVKGLHMHFLSDDFKKGGHVMNVFTSKNCKCRIGVYSGMNLDLFQSPNTIKTEIIGKNLLQTDIDKVEK